MEGTYGVYFGKQLCGQVRTSRRGLYLRIFCRCSISGDVVCRLIVKCGGTQEKLGIVVPDGDGFGLETSIPLKRLGQGALSFELVPNTVSSEGKFTPIYPEEPFAYIERLKDAYLARMNGNVGILIK